jgi:hypothetical protein
MRPGSLWKSSTASATAARHDGAAVLQPTIARGLRFIGLSVHRSATEYRVAWEPGRLHTAVLVVVGLLLTVYAVLYVSALAASAAWGPFATVDEQLQYYVVARNYNEHGFFANVLLPDLATASAPTGHPYTYNHQPPGPQVLIGLLMRLFGEDFRLVRLVLLGFFLAGLACFVRVVQLLGFPTHYAVLALALLPPGTVLHLVDHPGKSPFALAAFFPIVALERYARSGRRWWLVSAASAVFVASVYLMYSHLFLILAFWALGMYLGFLQIRGRELALFLGLAVAGIALHLLQTVLFAGPAVFVQELGMTLSNRMFGTPSRDEIADFYRAHSLVLYGGHTFEVTRLIKAIWNDLSFPARNAWQASIVIVGVAALALEIRHVRRAAVVVSRAYGDWVTSVVRVAGWAGLAVITPIVMFPAFASDYSLGGASGFVLALFVLVSFRMTCRFIAGLTAPAVVRLLLLFVMLAFPAAVTMVQLRDVLWKTKETTRWLQSGNPETDLRWISHHLAGHVTMTNVDPTVVGFFTREVAFGGCHRPAVDTEGGLDPSACKVHFIRGYPDAARPAPTAYVWVALGQNFCAAGEECLEREELDRRYAKLHDGRVFAAYDLTRPHPRRAAVTAGSPRR